MAAIVLLCGISFSLLVLVAAGPARWIMPPASAVAAEFPPSIMIVEGKTPQGYPYLSGGVGSAERKAMEERGKAYNLKLAFAESRGPFIADVALAIADRKGVEVVSIASTGPWFYVQLPSGSYSVKATYKGQMKEVRNLQVPKDKAVKYTLAWKLDEE